MDANQAERSGDETIQRRRGPRFDAGTRNQLLAGVPVSERQLNLNGVSTAVLEGGDGPPVVLLHGPGEYAAKWLRVIPDLARHHRVVAPDLPGHGASKPLAGDFDITDILAWLDELIERTCVEPPVLVGQILGGAIAARFAVDRSPRLRHLVLVDALGLADFRPAPEFGAALQAFVSAPSETTHEGLWQRCAYDLDALRDELGERWDLIEAYNIDRASEADLSATQQRLMELFGLSAISGEDLKRVAVPTTLIWGRRDLATAVRVAEDASDRYGWPLHIVEDAADDPPLEQPQAFLHALYAADSAVSR